MTELVQQPPELLAAFLVSVGMKDPCVDGDGHVQEQGEGEEWDPGQLVVSQKLLHSQLLLSRLL